jgi:hypothetical protein
MNMNFNIPATVGVFAALAALSSCQQTDREDPTACTGVDAEFSVTAAEIDVLAGDSITLSDVFCDDEGLSEVRWDIHSAEGHEGHEEDEHDHDEGEEHEEHEDEGLVLFSGSDWAVLENQSLSGLEDASSITLNVPLTARGIWHVNVSLVDSAGNAEEFVTDLHIENNHLPEFKLTSIDGLDPATLDDELEWNIGSLVLIEGVVSDSDGVALASLRLVEEDTDSVFWSIALAPAGATTYAFSDTLTAPSVAGDFHMELTATDGTGVEMETGFHVEVED